MKAIGIILTVIGALSFLVFGNAILHSTHDTTKGTDYLIREYLADGMFGVVALVRIIVGSKMIKNKEIRSTYLMSGIVSC
ncbi:MAG TPA: hypothetical protein VHB70_08220 [Parafilimonas sp.]|nr:hypothetical protein [Parafilimonas sp.]